MDRKTRGILVGMVLGDGHLQVSKDTRYKNSWKNIFVVKHSEKQRDYIRYKAELLHKHLGGKKPQVHEINNNGFPGYVLYKSDKYFRHLYRRMYKDRIKVITRKVLEMLTDEGLAIWYMDDGSLCAKKRGGKIHAFDLFLNTYCSEEECQEIVKFFKERYGIKFTVSKNKGKFRVRCGTKEARKFIEIVKPYIIPSMLYKVTMR